MDEEQPGFTFDVGCIKYPCMFCWETHKHSHVCQEYSTKTAQDVIKENGISRPCPFCDDKFTEIFSTYGFSATRIVVGTMHRFCDMSSETYEFAPQEVKEVNKEAGRPGNISAREMQSVVRAHIMDRHAPRAHSVGLTEGNIQRDGVENTIKDDGSAGYRIRDAAWGIAGDRLTRSDCCCDTRWSIECYHPRLGKSVRIAL